MSQNPHIIVAEQLSKYFISPAKQPFAALDNLSLSVQSGQISALVGPDGAGKTTFLRLICGLLQPSQGELSVLGLDVAHQAYEIQSRISYMPQRFGLYEDLTVQENFDLYARLHGVSVIEKQQRFERLMQMTDLAKFTDRAAGKLSGGMKQKLGLACTLVRSPDLLLLDEPSVGVDPLSRQKLWLIIQQLVADEQLTVLLSTTYLDEAAHCAEVFILNEGKILAQGTPESISNYAQGLCFSVSPTEGQHVRIVQSYLFDHPLIIDSVPQGGSVHLIYKEQPTESVLAQTLENKAYQAVPPSVEDGFMVLLCQKYEQEKTDKPVVRNLSIPETQKTISANESVITVKNIVRRFGDFTAVDRTTFEVKKGEIFGLLGSNGAGKTTTFRMLCGLLPATEGFLEVSGVNLRTARASARRKIGYVAQKFSLYGNLTVEDNLKFFGGAYGLYGKHLRQRIEAVVEEFHLSLFFKTTCAQIPGGFKQRMSMATALLHEPDILFLDEATSGADTLARRNFWRRIASLADSGTTIVITTHFMEEAEYCDRILIQDAGKMLALGTPVEVRRQANPEDANKISMDQAFIQIVLAARAQKQGIEVAQ